MRIGIIGFGAFGQLAAKHLAGSAEVVVTSRTDKSAAAKAIGCRQVSVKDACNSDAVLICVPISSMKEILEEIGPLVKPGTLVMDSCSVKVKPCKLMASMLPKDVEVLGTHPLFGPQSAANGLHGLQVVLCPVRIGKARMEKVKGLLNLAGLDAVVLSPEEHDREMARTQAITHFVCKGLAAVPKPRHGLRLKSHEALMKALANVKDDSERLFLDLQSQNPFAQGERKRFLSALAKIEERIGEQAQGGLM
jgi:prephenate dehydrogenase